MIKQLFKSSIGMALLTIFAAIAYYLSGRLVDSLYIPPSFVGVIWPAAGVGLAIAIKHGYKAILGIFLGDLFLSMELYGFNSSVNISLSLAISIGIAFYIVSALYLLRRYDLTKTNFIHAKSCYYFILLSSIIPAMIPSIISIVALHLAGKISDDWPIQLFFWWFGNISGVIIVTPVLLILIDSIKQTISRRILVLLASIICLSGVMLSYNFSYDNEIKRLHHTIKVQNQLTNNHFDNQITHLEQEVTQTILRTKPEQLSHELDKIVLRHDYLISLKTFKIDEPFNQSILSTKQLGYQYRLNDRKLYLRINQIPDFHNLVFNAFDKKKPMLSSPIMIQDTLEKDRLVYIAVIPVSYKGFSSIVIGIFDTQLFLSSADEIIHVGMLITSIVDNASNTILFNDAVASEQVSPLISYKNSTELYGRIFTISTHSSPDFIIANFTPEVWSILFLGVFVSNILTILILVLTGRYIALSISTNDLILASQVYASASDGIFFSDSNLNIFKVNQAFNDLTNIGFEENKKSSLQNVIRADVYEQIVLKLSENQCWSGEVLLNKSVFWLTISKIKRPITAKAVLIGHISNMTNYKNNQKTLERRITFENILAKTTNHFFENSDDRLINQSMINAMSQISAMLHVDRSFIYLYSEDKKTMKCYNEWCNENIASVPDKFRNVSISTFSWFYKELLSKGIVIVNNVKGLPPEAENEKQLLMNFYNNHSTIWCALKSKNDTIGFVGFSQIERLRVWQEEDILLLTLITNLFSQQIFRIRLTKKLTSSLAHNEEALKNNRLLLKHNKNLTQKVIQTQEQERRSIALELHDDFGQLLTAISLNVNHLKDVISNDNQECLQSLDTISNLSLQLIDGMRMRTRRLRSATLDQAGLIEAVHELIHDFAILPPNKITYDIDIDDNIECFNDDINITIYRIMQEALTNINKHSRANIVNIKIETLITLAGKNIFLSIKDNGHNIMNHKPIMGIGLLGMQERVNILNGDFHFLMDSDGFKINVLMPISS